MKKSKIISTILIKNEAIALEVYRMILKLPEGEEGFKNMNPGQFVNVYLKEKDSLLPRPISICMLKDNEVHLVYKVVGKGTKRMAEIEEGQVVRISTPLGNGYNCPSNKEVLLVGGGAGIPPMLALAIKLKELKCQVRVLLGYKDQCFLLEEMRACCDEVIIAMETENENFHGNIVQCLSHGSYMAEEAFACGPKAMLREVNHYCSLKDIDLQVSLEERMGCGYGACWGCAVTIDDGSATKKRVCKDGPVFIGSQVVWDE